MTRLPTAQDLGGRPSIQSSSINPSAGSGDPVGRAMQGLGQTLQNIGADIQEKNDKLRYERARSGLLQADLRTRAELRDIDDATTWDAEYRRRMGTHSVKAIDSLRDNQDAALFQSDAQLLVERGAFAVGQLAQRREIEQGRATLDDILTANRTAVMEAGDSATRQALIHSGKDAIRAAELEGILGVDEGGDMDRRFTSETAAALLGMLPADKRLEKLTHPAGTMAEFLPADIRQQLKERAKRDIADSPEARAAETRAKVQRSLDIANFKRAITASTTDKEISSFAKQAAITEHGTISGFFTERQKKREAATVFDSPFMDPTDKRVRDAVDMRVSELTDDPDERIQLAMAVAADTGIASTNTERYFEAGGRSKLAFAEATARYQEFREAAPNAYLPLSDDAKSLYSQAAVLSRAGMDQITAANVAWDIVNSATPEQIADRTSTYPGDEVVGAVIDELDDIPGMYAPGLLNDVAAEVPAEMAGDMNRIGLAVYQKTGSIDAAREAVKQNIPNAWQFTAVNKGVKVGDATLDAQYMKNAPRRAPEFVRKVLSDDIKGRMFFYANKLQTVKPGRVELYQPPLPESNEFGQPVWTLRVDGVPLLDDAGRVVRWTYEQPPGSEKNKPSRQRETLPAQVTGTIERTVH